MIDEGKIKQFAEENGYDDIVALPDWNGYKVYDPIYDDDGDEVSYTGYPLVILVKDDAIRMSTADESLEYLDYRNSISDNKSDIEKLKQENTIEIKPEITEKKA